MRPLIDQCMIKTIEINMIQMSRDFDVTIVYIIYVRAYMARAHILAHICTRAIASHSHLIISTLDYCSAIVVQYSFFF